MPELPNEVLYDVRLIERHIRQGLVKREDYEKYLAELADHQAEADIIDLNALAEMTTANRSAPS